MSVISGDLARADQLKDEGNKFFQTQKYMQAIEKYTEALQHNPTSEVLYSNRAFANLKMENYGSAIEDATRAIELAPAFVKAYYRRGSAYLMLGKYKQGLMDFKRVVTIAPRDPDAATKLRECEKAVKQLAFEKAIAAPDEKPLSETINIDDMSIEAEYSGPRIGDDGVITEQFVRDMVDHFRNQKLIHRKDAFRILLGVKPLLQALPNLQEVQVQPGEHFTVCGDIHGQFYDLLNIFAINGFPSPSNPYLFNGDFVDRGSFGLECILTLLAFKWLHPSSIHLTRGNHESKHLNQMYGFAGEVKAKYNDKLYALFQEVFNVLPLGTLINRKVMCVHGGLFSNDGVTLEDINKVNRFCQPPDEGLMCEMLWSDPQPQTGRSASKRGVALQFGPDVTHRFLAANNLDLIVRSHEVKENGYEVEAGGKLITVFSAPNYCDQMGNKGAFIRFESDLVPRFTTFDSVPHPQVKPMTYAGNPLVNFM